MHILKALRVRGVFALIATIAVVSLATAGPLWAVEPEDDTLLNIYRQVDRQVISPPLEPAHSAPTTPGDMEFPELSPATRPQAPAEWQPPQVTTTRRSVPLSEALNPPALSEGVRMASDPRQVPVLAVIDTDSDTLDPAALLTLTQLVWSEVQRVGRTRLLELNTTRHILARNDMTPSDPYRPSPSRHQMATVLSADFLVLGDVNHVENTFVIEMVLYSASSNSILNSVVEFSNEGFDGLVRRVPEMVQRLLGVLPQVRSTRAPGGAATAAKQGAMGQELKELRLENDRLRRRVMQLQQALALGSHAAPTPVPESPMGEVRSLAQPIRPEIVTAEATPSLLELPPVRGGFRKEAVTKKQWVREAPAPTPTPVIVTEAHRTEAPTVKNTPAARPTSPPRPTPTHAARARRDARDDTRHGDAASEAAADRDDNAGGRRLGDGIGQRGGQGAGARVL